MTRGMCEVAPGAGTIVRRGDSLLWAGEGTPDAVWASLRALVEFAGSAQDAQPLLDALAQAWLPQVPRDAAFALLVGTGGSALLLQSGAVTVLVDGQAVDGGPVTHVPGSAVVVLGAPEAANELAGGGAGRSDLADGTVPGGALRRTPPGVAAVRPAAVPPPAVDLHKPEAGPAPHDDYDQHRDHEHDEHRDHDQHRDHDHDEHRDHDQHGDHDLTAPDHPIAEPFAWASSAASEPAGDLAGTAFHPPPTPWEETAAPAAPDLGRLSFDDGTSIAVTGDLVLGRRPERHELVESGQAQSIVIHDNDNVLSSAHAAVQVHGDTVVVVDLGSLNGTHVAAPAAADWSRLDAGSPQQLHEGYRVLLGYTVLTYHAPA